MKIIDELKKFMLRGNVVDMAVGIIIGSAFGKIVESLVKDIIMPPLGVAIGGIDFSSFNIIIKKGNGVIAPVSLNYGMFIQTIINFVIIGFAIFLLVKLMNMIRTKKEEQKPPIEPASEILLREIRDLLKDNYNSQSSMVKENKTEENKKA